MPPDTIINMLYSFMVLRFYRGLVRTALQSALQRPSVDKGHRRGMWRETSNPLDGNVSLSLCTDPTSGFIQESLKCFKNRLYNNSLAVRREGDEI